jgi:hypothetical protein
LKELRQIGKEILSRGKVDSDHIESLGVALYAGGAVGRPAADFVVELHKRVQHPNPAFDHLFYRTLKDHVLVDGRVGDEEAKWLRRALLDDGPMKDEVRKFLHELKGEAAHAGPEFEALFAEVMKEPPERHTSGAGR